MIQVNTLINNAHEDIGVTGLEEDTSGTQATVGVRKLNELISTLNSEGYLSTAQSFLDVSPASIYYFKVLTEAERENKPANLIDMAPPEKIASVGRKIGNRYLPLTSADLGQMSAKNWNTLATGWNYGRIVEKIPESDPEEFREVGVLRMDGRMPQGGRVFFAAKIPTYTLDDTVYLSDLYNTVLLTGLSYYLAEFYHLDEATKADKYNKFYEAKNLIKRNNVTQHMIRSGNFGSSYSDQFQNAFCPGSW